MQQTLRSLTGETLLAIGGAYLFLSVFIFGLAALNPVCHAKLSYFECGQYYFNHDDDPAGPYDLNLAKYYYYTAIAEDPNQHILLWYQLGRIHFIEGDFDLALDRFATQVELYGDSLPAVYYMIGLTYGYQARRDNTAIDWKQAEDYFIRYIELDPDALWSRVDLAWIYFAQGKYHSMFPILEEGLSKDPNNPWLLNMYGLAHLNVTEDPQVALQYLKHAELRAAELTEAEWGKVYPGNDPAHWGMGLQEFRDTIATNIALLE